MRGACASVMAALLLAGCLPTSEPLAPELKGRWAAPNSSKLRTALLADRTNTAISIPANGDTSCRDQYVTFDKQRGITLYMDQRINPLFRVSDIKRKGARFILTGNMPIAADDQFTIEIVLRDGEIHFDDISDRTGRSLKYQRFEDDQARRVGITTMGDLFRLVLDLKPCAA